MLTYETLARKPGAFTSMTGLTIDEFEGCRWVVVGSTVKRRSASGVVAG